LDNLGSAKGSDATGFWFALPEHPRGKFEGARAQCEDLAAPPIRTFDGFMGDRAPRVDGHFAVGGYIAQADPADANSPQVDSVFEDFTSYKNRNSGIWARGEMHLYKNLKMADNAIGFTHASGRVEGGDTDRARLVVRGQANPHLGHARLPGALAELQAGWEIFVEFALEVGAIDHTEKVQLEARCKGALELLGAFQAKYQNFLSPWFELSWCVVVPI
jgi:hypothetical protein